MRRYGSGGSAGWPVRSRHSAGDGLSNVPWQGFRVVILAYTLGVDQNEFHTSPISKHYRMRYPSNTNFGL